MRREMAITKIIGLVWFGLVWFGLVWFGLILFFYVYLRSWYVLVVFDEVDDFIYLKKSHKMYNITKQVDYL